MAVIEKSKKKLLPAAQLLRSDRLTVSMQEHIASRYVVRAPERVLVQTLVRRSRPSRWHEFGWVFNEVSTLSALAALFLLMRKIAIVVFRLPVPSSPLVIVRLKPQRPVVVQPVRRTLLIEKTLISALPKPARTFGSVYPAFGSTAVFALSCLIILVPILAASKIGTAQAFAEGIGEYARTSASNIISGTQYLASGDSARAIDAFTAASENARAANHALAVIPQELKAGIAVLPTAGASFYAIQDLLSVVETLTDISAITLGALGDIQHTASAGAFATISSELRRSLPDASLRFTRAVSALFRISADALPEQYQSTWRTVRSDILPALLAAINTANDASAVLHNLSGLDEPKRVLLIFQNDNELRAGGGFMGSFAVLDIRGGEITNVTFPGGGTYDVQGALAALVNPPPALRLIAKRWELRDANWWYDWSVSGKKISWFYERSGGSTVDAVIGIDSTFVERLLTHSAPIALPQYGVTITADNFIATVTDQVERTYDKTENRPKQILADMFPLLLENLTQKAEQGNTALFSEFIRGTAEKHVMIYSRDVEVQRRLAALGWAGALPVHAAPTDSLAIVHSNIAGQKTDGVIRTAVSRSARLGSDGSVTNHVTVTRTHDGRKGDAYTGVRNVDYMRFYVPVGSELVSAVGFEAPDPTLFDAPLVNALDDPDLRAEQMAAIDATSGVRTYEELGRRVFASWLMVDPGETKTVELVYRLSSRLQCKTSIADWFTASGTCLRDYRFSWEQQPGSRPVTLVEEVIAPPQGFLRYQSSDGATVTTQQYRREVQATTDSTTAISISFPTDL